MFKEETSFKTEKSAQGLRRPKLRTGTESSLTCSISQGKSRGLAYSKTGDYSFYLLIEGATMGVNTGRDEGLHPFLHFPTAINQNDVQH